MHKSHCAGEAGHVHSVGDMEGVEAGAQLGYADSMEDHCVRIVYEKLLDARTKCARILTDHTAVERLLSTNHYGAGTDYHVRFSKNSTPAEVLECIEKAIHSIIRCSVRPNVGAVNTYRVSIAIDDAAADDHVEASRGTCWPLTILVVAMCIAMFLVFNRTGSE